MKIIVGLGNPGKKYEITRHNAGFLALDRLLSGQGLSWENNKKLNALIAKSDLTIYAKPQTFMNDSGRAVASLMSYYKLMPKKFGLFKEKNSDLSAVLTIIHDDLDIPLGKYKISVDSRSAGHKGVKSIINHLKTKNFQRLRIGIKPASGINMPAEKYVLGKFSEEELKIIERITTEISL